MDSSISYYDDAIRIRPYRLEDAEQLYRAARESSEHVYPWLAWCHPMYSLAESVSWIERCLESWENNIEYEFAITDLEDQLFYGGCGLNRIDRTNRTANLGYWIRSTVRGQGIAPTAALLATGFAFQALKYNRVAIISSTENKASLRVAEKAGASREGILRNRLEIHGRRHDAVLFSLLPEDLNLRDTRSSYLQSQDQ